MDSQKTFHFIGIKGAGMSALACILHDMGHRVIGFDHEHYFFTEEALRKRNIRLLAFSDFEQERTEFSQSTLVASRAYTAFNNELLSYCEANGVPFTYYPDLLSTLTNHHGGIAIAGTHGKTSTTGLLSHLFSSSLPVSYLIGDGTGFGTEHSKYFIFEACEYRDHFHHYEPDFAIITNIDWDHPDYFQNEDSVVHSFQQFVKGVKKGLLVCGENPNISKLSFSASQTVYTYGFNETNDVYVPLGSIQIEGGQTTFPLFIKGESFGLVTIPLVGTHAVLNVMATLGMTHLTGEHVPSAIEALLSYKGVKRRFNETTIGEDVIVDDYAHHPTEITATISAARLKYPDKKIVAIFQPHTYSRTLSLVDEFRVSLAKADVFSVFPVFASAREKAHAFHVSVLTENLPNGETVSPDTLGNVIVPENSVYLFMGAGDINESIPNFLTLLEQRLQHQHTK